MKTVQTALAVLFTVLSPAVHGLGIRIADQDPLATARGNAFAATADNPSAIYYNPAGISQLEGHNFRVGIYSIYLNSDYTSPGGATRLDTKDRIAALPQVYYAFTPKESCLSYGFGVYSPYGLGLEWPDNAPFRAVAGKGQIAYLTANPVVSLKLNEHLFVAAGPTINYADAELRQGVPGYPPGSGDRFRFTGDNIGYGFNLGLLWKPHVQHAFGINYRSATSIDFDGTAELVAPGLFNVRESSRARFDFPQNVVFGYSYRPTPQWNLEVNLDWTDWETLDTVNLRGGPFTSTSLPFNWNSSWFYEFGVTHYLENGYRLSGGYIYSENSVPTQFFNPVVPDSDRHIFSVGIGRTYKSRWNWDLAYQLAYGPSRTVPATTAFGPSVAGSYEFISHALTLSLGYSL